MAEPKTRVRALSAALVLVLIAITGTKAFAEPADKATAAPVPDNAYIGNESLETCMARWDADTHMTKDAWRETCKRLKKEREPYANRK